MRQSAETEARRARGEGLARRSVNDPRKQALHLSLIFLGWTLVGAGCGPAQQKTQATLLDGVAETRPREEKKSSPPPLVSPELPPLERERHIEDAAAEVDLAERTLEENLVKERAKPAPPRPPKLPAKPAPTNAEPKEGCERACLALASMQSAVEHLCRLSSPTDGRCRKARLRLESATSKVAAAACGCSASM